MIEKSLVDTRIHRGFTALDSGHHEEGMQPASETDGNHGKLLVHGLLLLLGVNGSDDSELDFYDFHVAGKFHCVFAQMSGKFRELTNAANIIAVTDSD